ncbi:MAG: DUF2062 domain-containing protein [Akkermansiaceae bacterium]|nr:DUF2062 domain-containing protein [Akkermansiaceae bacterium]
MLRHKRLRGRPWWRRLTRPLFDRQLWVPCRDTVASGLAIGFFFSMMAMPFQMAAAALTAMRFRGNIPFAVAGCWVSNLATHVPIWVGQEWLGDWMREKLNFPMPEFLVTSSINIPTSWENFYEKNPVGEWMQNTVGIALPHSLNAASFLLGMMVSGIFLAVISYPLVHLFSALMPQFLPVINRREARVRREKKEA